MTFQTFSEFAKEKERVENKAGFMKIKIKEKLERDLHGWDHKSFYSQESDQF